MTWTRSGHFKGSWKDKENGYFNSREILKRLQKRPRGEYADILVVEENGWDSHKTKTYQEQGKIVLSAADVYNYITENHPEYLL